MLLSLITSISNSSDVDFSYLWTKGLSISPSYIQDTSDCCGWFGLFMLLLMLCLGSSIIACTSTIALLSLNWDLLLLITGFFGFSTKWSRWYVPMMVRVGPIKVFLGLRAFLCTTRISLCNFCAKRIAQNTSPSSTTWITTTSVPWAYL